MEVNSFYILLVDVTLFLNENPHAAPAVKGLRLSVSVHSTLLL